jgi:hypothetical protein
MNTLQDIDAALLRLPATPKTDEDLEARHRLMVRRIELDQAQRAKAAADRLPKQRGNLVVFVPDGFGISHYHGAGGRVVQSRVEGDCVVLDLFPAEFRTLLADRSHGLAWLKANEESVVALGQLR